jgi:hypothetical protein
MRDEGHTSDDDKEDWPGWKQKRKCLNLCPCCQYVDERVKHFVSAGKMCGGKCPLINIWPYIVGRYGSPCVISGPYRSFCKGMGTSDDAQIIIDECNRLLEELN